MGQRPFLGLNFRMTELSGAVLVAQLAEADRLLAALRTNKALFKSLIADVPGVSFRALPDPDGDIATYLTVLFPNEQVARLIAADLGSRVAADSGWHIYSQMEHLLQRRMPVERGCPFDCDCHFDGNIEYRAGNAAPDRRDRVAGHEASGSGSGTPISDRPSGSACWTGPTWSATPPASATLRSGTSPASQGRPAHSMGIDTRAATATIARRRNRLRSNASAGHGGWTVPRTGGKGPSVKRWVSWAVAGVGQRRRAGEAGARMARRWTGSGRQRAGEPRSSRWGRVTRPCSNRHRMEGS